MSDSPLARKFLALPTSGISCWLLLAAGLGACAGTQTEGPAAVAGPGAIADDGRVVGDGPSPMPAPPPDRETCAARDGAAVRRDAVIRAIDTGLGFWLRGVKVQAQLDGSRRFRGWLVQSLYPNDVCYQGIDLRAGDVVTRINGKSVERDYQAHGVFIALRTAREIVVDFEREGQPRTLRVSIVDR